MCGLPYTKEVADVGPHPHWKRDTSRRWVLIYGNLYSLCLAKTTRKREHKETNKIQKYKRDNT